VLVWPCAPWYLDTGDLPCHDSSSDAHHVAEVSLETLWAVFCAISSVCCCPARVIDPQWLCSMLFKHQDRCAVRQPVALQQWMSVTTVRLCACIAHLCTATQYRSIAVTGALHPAHSRAPPRAPRTWLSAVAYTMSAWAPCAPVRYHHLVPAMLHGRLCSSVQQSAA
jgi:hypothetical protein